MCKYHPAVLIIVIYCTLSHSTSPFTHSRTSFLTTFINYNRRRSLNPEGTSQIENDNEIHGKGYDVENDDMLHNSLISDSILEKEQMERIREDGEQLQILKDYNIDVSDYYDEVQQISTVHENEEQVRSFLDDGLRELERMDFARARDDDEQLQLLIEAETQRDDEERMDELVRLHDYTQIYTEEYCNNDINNTTIGTNIDKYNNGQDSNIRDSDLDELVACCEERDEKYPYNYLYDQQQHNAINADDGAYHCSSLGRCIICMAAYRTHAFVPCGHLCVCHSCATQVTTVAPSETERNTDNDDQEEHAQCPFCNQAVNSAIKIYLP